MCMRACVREREQEKGECAKVTEVWKVYYQLLTVLRMLHIYLEYYCTGPI